ncbi:hypothetical protein C8J56DRAFT_915986 [Mycena floridula]|nr:hypothetical protein C8J56DRAFT_915986 [Mycena floridula]
MSHPPTHIPTEFAPTTEIDLAIEEAIISIPPALSSSRHNVLVSALAVLLHRYSGDTDVVFGIHDIGCIRISIDPLDTFATVLERVVAPLPGQGEPKVLFGSSGADFSIEIDDSKLKATYNRNLYTSLRAKTLLEQIQVLLLNVAANPSMPVGVINIRLNGAIQNTHLPDPTAPLNWCDFKGAITDVFSRNARKWPDRVCVVQSLPFVTGQKQQSTIYTYSEILHASNLVAHHLLGSSSERAGISPEDVVMIYAHRSVDLVVAVMGVLKAGGTVSVIDPLYPPARQIIYLRVAQPKGLIILKGAGELHPSVREYIDHELDIKVEVPSLEILPSKAGVRAGNPDILRHDFTVEQIQALESTDPDVVLGPDSIATLSFTSGSTGTPKGVRGRHFSLTGFFGWMAEEFEFKTSGDEVEKFTMLSGIAHDPIQRDIFTPLSLGAQLHVPTPVDIGTPGRLVRWMRDAGVTVTHLTPAMGQLVASGVSSDSGDVTVPALRNAFFVGDLLTKRDCIRLQKLAPNCRIVNMYGTTETQRAVSYYPLSPASSTSSTSSDISRLKAIIPAGRGMRSVQLVVANLHDKNVLCGVGEIGEIWVRSGGLSEGYLKDTNEPEEGEKFVTNWFSLDPIPDTLASSSFRWHGPRDRLYRSGDLGRYLPNGDVECTGRKDGQVKIRGFRIETGEVEGIVSEARVGSITVRENVVMVRRDMGEEKVLVCYFVASEVMDDYAPLIKKIREYCKDKLAGYSVPSLFIPLPRMPLNPNGKIDKPALPFPDTPLDSLDSEVPTDEVGEEADIKRMSHLFATLLPDPPAPLPLTSTFFDLGGHSILATRLIMSIKKVWGVEVGFEKVFGDSATVLGLVAEVRGLNDKTEHVGKSEYAADLDVLLPRLLPSYLAPHATGAVVFLTGGTGFLGGFVLKDLLNRSSVSNVVCLVRGDNGMQRLKKSCQDRDVWDENWIPRLQVVSGDLGLERFGMTEDDWKKVATETDVVVHNGALVHWVYPYTPLRAPNVLSTLTAMDLCATTRPKRLVFVSSTSVLDISQYATANILESDSLSEAAEGLPTGYGQSKWVAEQLVMEAGRRGLEGFIIRPGYVVGSATGVTNTDDFIWRLVKGSIQLGVYPADLSNSVNMVSVDWVAACIGSAATVQYSSTPTPFGKVSVLQITATPLPTFSLLFQALELYGWDVQGQSYRTWVSELESSVNSSGQEENALLPLLHMVLSDLPESTKAPTLDDSGMRAVLAASSSSSQTTATVDFSLMGIYLAWLVRAGWLSPPTRKQGKVIQLPDLGDVVATAAGRRGV